MNELMEFNDLNRQDEDRERIKKVTDAVADAYIKKAKKWKRRMLFSGVISLILSSWLLQVLIDELK